MMKGSGDLMKASSFFENIEIIQKRLPVAHHLKHPTSCSTFSGSLRTEVELGEMQDEGIDPARVYWNRVREVPKPLAREKVWVLRIHQRMRWARQLPVHEVVIR